ncbi:MAG: hypothetical protein ACFE8J_16645 [Candidatus Heimdallarchaeota archaeon]
MDKRFIPLLMTIGFIIILIITATVAAVFGFPVIAVDETNISTASFDYWTIGHLLVGIALFVFCFTIGFIIKNLPNTPGDPLTAPDFKKLLIFWVITIIVAGLWEIVENTLLYFVGVKNKFDSAPNIITDIVIWGVGGLVSWYMTDLMFLSQKYIRAYYIYGIINLITGLIMFIVFGYFTTNF